MSDRSRVGTSSPSRTAAAARDAASSAAEAIRAARRFKGRPPVGSVGSRTVVSRLEPADEPFERGLVLRRGHGVAGVGNDDPEFLRVARLLVGTFGGGEGEAGPVDRAILVGL